MNTKEIPANLLSVGHKILTESGVVKVVVEVNWCFAYIRKVDDRFGEITSIDKSSTAPVTLVLS